MTQDHTITSASSFLSKNTSLVTPFISFHHSVSKLLNKTLLEYNYATVNG